MGSIVLLGYITTDVMRTPELRRFFVIHRTLMREGYVDEGAIRLTNIEAKGSKGITVDLAGVRRKGSEGLEALVGRIFHLEDELRAEEEEETRDRIFFQAITIRRGEARDVRVDRRTYGKRKAVRDAIAPGGRLRTALSSLPGASPDGIDLGFEERDLLSRRVGISLRLPGDGEVDLLTRWAGEAARITFETLLQQIDYLRIEFLREGSRRIYLTTPQRYTRAKSRAGDPARIRWDSIFQVSEEP